jgi:phosphopantothenoylcysteine decarboxylase/phosphopantothenate--cysteine ligase
MEAQPVQPKSLLLCVTGSIGAATSAALLLQTLVERRIFKDIFVAISQCALKFVREEPFAVLSKRKCITDLFEEVVSGRVAHVEVARKCQIALIAPASANTIAKLAHGICDDTVTNMLSVFEGQRVIVPAVHPATSRKPSFERNMRQLQQDGFILCGPVPGYSLSEDRRGPDVAAMPSPETTAAFVEYLAHTGEPPPIKFAYPRPDAAAPRQEYAEVSNKAGDATDK